MSTDFVMRSTAILACATFLSLFSTIAAYAAVGITNLGRDACRSATCPMYAKPATPRTVQMAKVPARAS